MKRLWLFLALSLISSSLFAALTKDYVSYEIMEKKGNTIYVRFRVNVPYLIQFAKDQIQVTKNQIAKEKNPRKKAKLEEILAHYEQHYDLLSKNKVKAICVFGDFNGWATFASEIPNKLEPTSKNPDTWYTKILVPFVIKPGEKMQLRYKFVIDVGVQYKAKDGKPQDYLYLEDPINPNKDLDGFDGYNSYFVYEGN
ncbi:hypothetical protein [Thermospira aquatica]|uniref:GLPGLI family protein n=1 Tax=Thermospira aquatica TaxID=2828656 RepID=A0AAX3BC93_9SPIR|nr:hypothetical protein [Thermospira aquatica]URA09609.1 hypothetical protein KDW03_08945 [Thermospira aquatica]